MRPLAIVALIALAGCATGPTSLVTPLRCVDPCVRELDPERPGGEASIAVDPRDADRMLVADNGGNGWVWSYATRDRGATWSAVPLPAPPGESPSDPAEGLTDPAVGILPSGVGLVTYFSFHQFAQGPVTENTYYPRDALLVARTTDGGSTFEPPVVVQQAAGSVVLFPAPLPGGQVFAAASVHAIERPNIAVGPDGTAILGWTEHQPAQDRGGARNDAIESSNLFIATSTDEGKTWTSPALVASGHVISPGIAVDRDGTIVITTLDYDPMMHVDAFVSHSRGVSWERSSIGDRATYDGPPMVTARAGRSGEFAVVFGTAAQGLVAPMLVTTRDGGRTWSQPRALERAEAPGGVFASVASSPAGHAIATFYHPIADGRARFLALDTDVEGASPIVLDPAARVTRDYSGSASSPNGIVTAWVTRPDKGLGAVAIVEGGQAASYDPHP